MKDGNRALSVLASATRSTLRVRLIAALLALFVVAGVPAQDVAVTSGQPLVSAVPAVDAVPTVGLPLIVNAVPVELTFTRVRTSVEEIDFLAESLTGLVLRSGFGVIRLLGVDPSLPGMIIPVEPPTPFSLGAPSGTNPSEGLLFWTGTAIGLEVSQSAEGGTTILGEMAISIESFNNPHANLSFFNLWELETGTPRSSFGWSNLPVQSGAFSGGESGSRIEGRFYGADHISAGGIFEHSGIVGAFGAEREHARPFPGPDMPPDESNAVKRLVELVIEGLEGWSSSDLRGGSSGMFSLSTLAPEMPPEDFRISGGQTSLSVRGVIQGLDIDHAQVDLVSELGVGMLGSGPLLEVEVSGFVSRIGHSGLVALRSQIQFGAGLGAPSVPPIVLETNTAGGLGFLANPVRGVAQWEGVMVGRDVSETFTRGNRISGDALISVEFSGGPEVSVQFTNVVDVDYGIAHGDISWEGMPVSKGAFSSVDGTDTLRGAFVGFSGTNVAGLFERNGVSGTFGASRIGSAAPRPPCEVVTGRAGDPRMVHLLANFESLDFGSGFSGSTEAIATLEGLVQSLSDSPEFPFAVNGVEVEQFELTGVPIGGVASSVEGFGGWLDEGYVAVAKIERPEADDTSNHWATAAMMVGTGSESNPSNVSASWRGAMFGIDVSDTPSSGELVRGNATITLRHDAYLTATVAFTGIVEIASDTPRFDLWWIAIPVKEGSFAMAKDEERLAGQFLGADHLEVAGSFAWHDLVGVFGARQVMP